MGVQNVSEVILLYPKVTSIQTVAMEVLTYPDPARVSLGVKYG